MARRLSHDLIYEAVLDDDAFSSLPQALAEASGARSSLMQWQHKSGDAQILAHSGYFTDDIMDQYAAHYVPHDLWLNAGLQSNLTNRMVNFDALVNDEVFLNSVIYNEFIRGIDDDTFRCMGAIFDTPFGMGAIGIHRGRRHDSFEPERIAEIEAFTTDLRRMMAIRGELIVARADKQAAQSSFDSLELAIMQVDGECRLLDGNVLADELLTSGLFRQVRGYLRASGPEGEAVKKAVRRATDPARPEASLLAIDDGRVNLSVTVSPLLVPGAKPRALILVKPPFGRQRDLDKHLMRLFGLSQAEAAISISLAEGLSPADIAERRQVAEGTVRVQVKTIMAKLGCRRQAQIAAAVLSLPPLRLS